MRKTLSIINIDGTDGAGKTTQINILANRLRLDGIKVVVNHLNDNIQSAHECAEMTWEFLDENPDGVVLNDGSIARMMVADINNNMTQTNVLEKYRKILHEHECLNHKYGMANILFVLDDIVECNVRIAKRNKAMQLNTSTKINAIIENGVMKGIRDFDNNVVSKSLKFHVFELDKDDSILETKDFVMKYLEENFTLKKPSI